VAKNKTITEIAVLSLLSARPMYGVEMVEEIKRLSGGVVVMPLPTLYSALHKMDAKKFIRSYWREAEIGGRCRVYNTTAAGQLYYEQNKFEINYEALKREAVKPEHKVYSTLEEAFSLPLSNNKEKPAEAAENLPQQSASVVNNYNTQIIINEIPADKPTAAQKQKQEFVKGQYIAPNETILATPKQQQMSIDISGIHGDVNLRQFIDMNAVPAQSGFVLINLLRLFAGLIAAVLFATVYTIMFFTLPEATIYIFAFVALGVYLAIDFLIWLILPLTKRRPNFHKLLLVRAAVSIVGILIVLSVYLMNVPSLVNIEPLVFGLVPGIFALIPFVEGLIMLILHRSKFVTC
jgi:DNA-binding PadR family transcriptional regulator